MATRQPRGSRSHCFGHQPCSSDLPPRSPQLTLLSSLAPDPVFDMIPETTMSTTDAAKDFNKFIRGRRFATVLADPPWRFINRTGKVAPEHRRLTRYDTMATSEICALPVQGALMDTAHCYLWVPNALLPDGLAVMAAWGFQYKANLVWHKIRKDGGPDGRGVGFYFRNTTELVLFGTRGKNARTLAPGRRQVNFLATRKREHSRKPDELYEIIESCSPAPRLELFARGTRKGWSVWGNQADDSYEPSWPTYGYNSASGRPLAAASRDD